MRSLAHPCVALVVTLSLCLFSLHDASAQARNSKSSSASTTNSGRSAGMDVKSVPVTEERGPQAPAAATPIAGLSGPEGIGVNTVTNRIYIANRSSNTVRVVNGFDNSTVTDVTVGSSPIGVAVNSVTNRVYVANSGSNTVSVIDSATNTVVGAPIPVGDYPYEINVNPVTNRIYTANAFGNSVTVIDGATNTAITTITGLPANPLEADVNPVTNKMYVSSATTNTVSVINGSTNMVTGTVTLPGFTHSTGIGINPVTNKIYVVTDAHQVYVIDGKTDTLLPGAITVGNSPFQCDVNPVTNKIYVTNVGSDDISIINGSTNTVEATVPVGDGPAGVEVNPSTNRVYVSNRGFANGTFDGTTASVITDFQTQTVNAGNIIISEFRFRGPNGDLDEFVDLYNKTDTDITVNTTDGSAGWSLVALDTSANPVALCTIPNGTIIPARRHYLAVNNSASSYSLTLHPSGAGTFATGNISFTTDILDDWGIALFNTATPANFTPANTLDAVGFGGAPTGYFEGTPLPFGGISTNNEHSFVRRMGTAQSGIPQDTNDNLNDFVLVETNGAVLNDMQSIVGSPGPENLFSPVNRTSGFSVTLIEPLNASTSSPNRVRFGSGNAGTLEIRRRYTNNTGQTITRFRVRVTDITTLGNQTAGQADVRPINSTTKTVSTTSTGVSQVLATTIEIPPTPGANGGGLNTTLTTTLPAAGLAPGATLDLNFTLKIVQSGTFRYFVNIEALP